MKFLKCHPIAIGGISGALIVTRESKWTRISKQLQVLYEANLMQLDAEEFDPQEKAEELGSCYFEFQRGNYEREVLSLHSGLAGGNTADIPYQLIEFHWVELYLHSDCPRRNLFGTIV